MKIWLRLLVLAALWFPLTCSDADSTLRVMTFNIWGGGLNDGQTIDSTLSAIRAADADLIGLQEVRAESSPCPAEYCRAVGPSVAPALAAALGYVLFEQPDNDHTNWASAILSRYPITHVSDAGLGVAIDVNGRRVALFNIHLSDFPYQPYQATGIPYGDAPFLDDPDDLVGAALAARSAGVDLLADELEFATGFELTIITGDFNEPSHLDWTAAAARAGLHPLAVPFPASRRLAALGFVDAWRRVYPDEVQEPGLTWSAHDPADAVGVHHDRIDFIHVRGGRVTGAWLMGGAGERADVVVQPWPSDHRAVVVAIEFTESSVGSESALGPD